MQLFGVLINPHRASLGYYLTASLFVVMHSMMQRRHLQRKHRQMNVRVAFDTDVRFKCLWVLSKVN